MFAATGVQTLGHVRFTYASPGAMISPSEVPLNLSHY